MRIETAPEYKKVIIANNGLNQDIIKTINGSYLRAVNECKPFAERFRGATVLETSRNIWNYLKKNIIYKKDAPNTQIIRMPKRFNADREGDCKSYSLFTAGILGALGIPNGFRYASYKANDATPSHIYSYAIDENGKKIIIDGVYDYFNSESPYKHKIDVPMQIAVISDNVSKQNKSISLEKLLSMLPPGKFLFVATKNQLNKREGVRSSVRYNRVDLDRYKKRLENRLPQIKFPALKNVLLMELADINNGTFAGSIPVVMNNGEIAGITEEIGKLSLKKIRGKIKAGLKKVSLKNIVRGVKMVGLVPVRKAFLALVVVNALGLASRLAKLNPAQLNKLWADRFGGKTSVLQSAINRGKNVKPLVKRGKKIRGINGLGSIELYNGLGEEGKQAGGMDLTQLISIAKPILDIILGLLQKAGVPQEKEVQEAQAAGDVLTFDTPGTGSMESYNSYEREAIKTGQETGTLPEKPLTESEKELNDVIPGDDYKEMEGDGSSLAPLLIGGAALALLASKS